MFLQLCHAPVPSHAAGNLKRKIANAHTDAVGRLVGAGDRSLFAAGDDSGKHAAAAGMLSRCRGFCMH